MRDQLPLTPKVNESGIINYDLSSNPGTHWASFKKIRNKVYFFDSFGLPPPDEFKIYLGRENLIFYNTQVFQKANDTNCGQLSLQFLWGKVKTVFYKVL